MSKIFSNALFEAKERESAVSPVVGVMLMLVVTIIIAATVSAFAGGLVGTSDKAPTAAFEVKINSVHEVADWGSMDYVIMPITHLGGDPIDTSRMKIITQWTNRTTNEVYYAETTALPASETPQVYNVTTGNTVNLNLANANYNSSAYKYQEPYFVIPNHMPSDDPTLWYGNFILHPGELMKIQGSLWYKDHSPIKEVSLLSDKDVVNVKFIDIPTGSVIYDKNIYVTKLSVEG